MTETYDLTKVKPQGKPNPDNLGSPDDVSAGRRLEATRTYIAYALLAILGAVVLIEVLASAAFANACWMWGSTCKQAQGALAMITSNIQTIFTAMVGLVGSVVGFYFGSKSSGGNGG